MKKWENSKNILVTSICGFLAVLPTAPSTAVLNIALAESSNIDLMVGYYSEAVKYALAIVGCLLYYPLYKLVGLRVTGLICMVLQSGLSWTMIWISNKEMVYLGAAITGLGGGFLWCILPVVIMDNSDEKNAQRNMSFLWFALSLGAMAGGLLNYFYFDGVTTISVENRELVYSVSAGVYIFAGLVAAIGLSDVREKSQREQDTPIFRALSWFKRMIKLPAFWSLGLPLIYWGFIWGYFVKILPTAIPSMSDSRNLIPLTTVIHGAGVLVGATVWDLVSRITNTVTCVILATLMLLASLILSVLIIPKGAASEILDISTIET